MNKEERKAIWQVLKALLIEGEEWVGQQSSKRGTNTTSPFEPLKQRSLESYQHKPSGAFKPGVGIQVKPPCREVRMSALWCKWDFNGERSGCWFHLGIWLNDVRFIAFRFEPPEQGDNHNYYHSQPCRTMGWQGDPTYEALAMPKRNPTWPLPAASSLELLLCLVVSIRGMVGFKELEERIEAGAATRRNRPLNKAFGKIAKLQITPAG